MNIGELAKFRGGIATDTISEQTSASGVTIDSVLCKDGNVTGAASGTFTTTYVKAADTQGLALVNSSGTSVVTVSDAGTANILKTIRTQGASAPSSGAGVEIDYGSVAANTGRVLCYDRTGNARKDLVIDGQTVDIYANGSSLLAASGTTVTSKGFTALGSGNTAIKMKTLTGTTASSEGAQTTVAHGLTSSKIYGVTAHVFYSSTSAISPEYSFSAGYQYSLDFNGTSVNITNHPTNSENILSKSFVIMVWYIE